MQAKASGSRNSQSQRQKQGQGMSTNGSAQASIASQANLKEASVPALSSSSAPERQSLEAIKSLFPDYGDLFLIACLQVFDGSVDRTIDALLSENLPPSLLTMDRTIKKAWLGKGGGESVAISQGTQGRSNETVYHLTEDKNAKESLREQVRAERRQWEQDMALIAREYDDDYDDQYDEALAYKPSVASSSIVEGNDDSDTSYPIMSNGDKADTTSGSSVSKTTIASRPSSQGVSKEKPSHKKATDTQRGDSRQESSINIHQQMAEMKRLNQITREDEREVQFWKDMRNDNHKVPIGQTQTQGGDDRSVATATAKPASKSQRPSDKQPSSQRAQTDQAPSHGRTKADALHRKEPSATTSATPFTSAKPREPQQPSAKAVNGATSATNTTDSDTSTPPPTPAPQQPQPQPHKRDNKKFDRHHQRDRAARKMI